MRGDGRDSRPKWGRAVSAGVVGASGTLLVRAALARWLSRVAYAPDTAARLPPLQSRTITIADGARADMLHLPASPGNLTVWYFHGNAEDLGTVEGFLDQFNARGLGVFAVEYPGYGRSGGQPTEAALYAAARAGRRILRDEHNVPARQTLLYGNSLGAGVALQMAVEEPVAGVVVQSSFTSLLGVGIPLRWLPFDQYRNLSKVARLDCPVLVIHGRDDELIGVGQGHKLYDAVRGPKHSLWVAGAGHNDVIAVAGDAYWTAIRKFSALCAAGATAS